MSCYNHPSLGSVAVCSNCGKEICAACATEFNEKVVCRDCADKLRKEAPPQAPAPVEAADNGQKPTEAPHVPPAPEPSKETMPATVPVTAPTVPTAPAAQPPEPPKVPEQRSPIAPAEKKEPLLALILSAIIPGLGQMYNGQVKKGIILLIGCILLWIVVVVCSSAMTRYNGVSGCCCLTWWIPLLVNVYAAYDGYVTANNINKGEPAKDWLS